jgi:hypothetical protein
MRIACAQKSFRLVFSEGLDNLLTTRLNLPS